MAATTPSLAKRSWAFLTLGFLSGLKIRCHYGEGKRSEECGALGFHAQFSIRPRNICRRRGVRDVKPRVERGAFPF